MIEKRPEPSSQAHGSALTLEQLFSVIGTTRSEVVAVGYRGKAGRASESDNRLVSRCFSKLKTKKWAHLYDAFFALTGEGARQAVAEVNPFKQEAQNESSSAMDAGRKGGS